MNRTVSMKLALALLIALTSRLAVWADDEEKVPLDKVPKAVLDAVKAKFPDGKVLGAEKEKSDGKIVYELNVALKDTKMDVSVTPEGKIVSVEKTIAVKDLPKPVAAALAKKYPKATIQSAEEISDGADKIVKYEAIIVTAEKKKFEVSFDPAGKFLEEEAKKEEKKEEKK